MKPDHDYIDTSIWYKEEITDPYQVIAEFFAAADVASHRKDIKDAINAAYLINKEKKKSPLSIGKDDLFNPNLFCSWHADLTAWDFFPRSLSLKEYIDPYWAFKRFFKHLSLPEWKRELHDIVEYALVETSFPEACIDFDTLPIYFHLTKLIEAAHLIDVREITHIGGIIKNRVKKVY